MEGTLFQPVNGRENGIHQDSEPEIPTDDDGKDVTLPDYDEFQIAIARLKNNNTTVAYGFTAELFKHSDEETRPMLQLLCRELSD